MLDGWSDTATAYDRSFARLCAGAIDGLLGDHVSVGDDPALDVGTGTGSVVGVLIRRGFAVTACDKEPSMVRFAVGRYPTVDIGTAALPSLPYDDGSFALTTANFVLNHVPTPLTSARELLRVTRPGGTVAATIWPSEPVGALNQFWNMIIREADVTVPAGHRLPPADDFPRSVDGFRELFRNAGATTVDCSLFSYTFQIRPDDLWAAVTAGIATIGQTYTRQTDESRGRMQAVFTDAATRQAPSNVLSFESKAVVAHASVR
ncbi:class I SAM-dependent methyltransferase [Curtobacterium sp. MCPF17_021]|uniref:class I SAM-dependent methyltransferase n=1 Tax=Curtobacterium sp. MCPF17_021 TaxID=2175639 RepID=UPI000DA88309|nr:class I SAM-dependent methyltransferase [Curtobacterium sp. MCPF17_021]WIE82832.1 class I SAM-dependent methyltransferase [Curtobacterium sp. MCPF17_021]